MAKLACNGSWLYGRNLQNLLFSNDSSTIYGLVIQIQNVTRFGMSNKKLLCGKFCQWLPDDQWFSHHLYTTADLTSVLSIHHPSVNWQRNTSSHELFTRHFEIFWLVPMSYFTANNITVCFFFKVKDFLADWNGKRRRTSSSYHWAINDECYIDYSGCFFHNLFNLIDIKIWVQNVMLLWKLLNTE